MKRIALMAAALAACAACNKTDASASASSSGTTAASSAAPEKSAPPFTGKLTGERVMGAKGLVRPFMPWAEAHAKLEAQLGKATLVADKKNAWAVVEGDACTYLVVERQANDQVGMVQDPSKVTKATAFGWDDCLTAAGVSRDADEDPNAPGPPTDGKPVTVLALRDGASKARAKWAKAKVTVKGLYLSTSTAKSGGVTYATVTLTAAKSDSKNTISCSLADPSTAPEKLMQYAPITASGDVGVANTVTLGGDRSVSVSLQNCAIAGQKK